MKKWISIFISFALGLSIVTTLPSSTSANDISGHWAKASLEYAIKNNYLFGDSSGNYNPDADITRASFATILVRVLDLKLVKSKELPTYKDVKKDDWYYNSIMIASQHKLVSGDTAGNFKPKNAITRQEIATMVHRAVKYKGYATLKLNLYYDDTNQIANWAKQSIQEILSLQLMSGTSAKKFSPKDKSSRAQAVVILQRFANIDPKNPIKVGQQTIQDQINKDYNDALNKQANANPKVDGAGLFIASKDIVSYFMNPGTFDQLSPEYYQFLKLDEVVPNLNASTINKAAFTKQGTLLNKAQSFINAGKKYNVNALYLMSHAIHETGNGTSKLAMGIEVGKNANGAATMVTTANRSSLKEIKTVYNMYGIAAYDATPTKSGSEYAYRNGWTTPDLAIEGGAKFIYDTYIVKRAQNTLYKMRWNPENPASMQYATHIQWAEIAARKIHNFYELTGADKSTVAIFEVPTYVNQPAPIEKPAVEKWYAVGSKNAGKTATVNTASLNVRLYPGATLESTKLGQLLKGTEFKIIGENGGWYYFNLNGVTGWVSGQYLIIK